MPSANRQCSKLISGGIRLPEAKLPGRSEIDKIIRKGNITSAISAITATWAARMRQRLERSTTIAICCPLCFVHARQAHVDQRNRGHEEEDQGRDGGGQAKVLAGILERNAVGVGHEQVRRAGR